MDKAGTLVTSLASGVFLFGGWTLLYAASLKLINHEPGVLGIFYAIQQFGGQGAFYAAFVGNMGNFKLKHRGTVTGILVSMYGLSALLISQLYAHVFNSDVPTLFLFMAVWTLALCIMGACALRIVKPYSSKTRANERLIPIVDEATSAGEGSGLFSDAESDTELAKQQSAQQQATLNPPRYGQRRFFTLLSHPDFWLLAVVSFCTAGSGLTFITSVGFVAESWKATSIISAATFTSVLSICNCAGRLIYGFLNDGLRKYVRSTTLLIPISLTIGIAHFLMIFWVNTPLLMIGTILTGLSYGGFFATINLIINKYYGDENYSSNLGFNTLVISLAGLIMGQISGKIYDHFAINKVCYGSICYRYTFTFTSALCFIAAGVALFVVIRERRDDSHKKKLENEVDYLVN
jgi:MFS family permease